MTEPVTTTPYDAQIPRESDGECGLPIGPRVTDAAPAPKPEHIVLDGRFCRLEPLDPKRHGDDLFRASTPPDAAARYLYLPVTRPADRADFDRWIAAGAASVDPLYFAVIDKQSGRCEGRQSLMRIDPPNRSIEIGDIYWGPAIARTPVTTEANFLFATYAFDTLGYRRYEWKCNALNAPSRTAAERFGFTYEGHFRRAAIVKARSRDTTWYSMIAEDWPQLRAAYQTWLAPGNFDAQGRQRLALSALTEPALAVPGLHLRRAATSDLAQIIALQRAAYAPNRARLGVEPIPLQADYAAVLASKEVWLAFAADQLAATLILEPHADHLLIWSIATQPGRQRQGLGVRLLAAADARARSLGLSTVRLYTGTMLGHLVAWYGRQGFTTDRIEQFLDRSVTHMSKVMLK